MAQNPSFVGLVLTDKRIFNNDAFSIEQGKFNFERGTTYIPIKYHGNKCQLIKAGQLVGKVFTYRMNKLKTFREQPTEYNLDTFAEIPDFSINGIFEENEHNDDLNGNKPRTLSYDSNKLLSEKIDQGEIDINP